MEATNLKEKQLEWNRAWRKANPDKVRAASRKYYAANREKKIAATKKYSQEHAEEYRAYRREWYHANKANKKPRTAADFARWRAVYLSKPENQPKRKARNALKYAITIGEIKRLPCMICGSLKSEAHHHDYSLPLDVTWLCRMHHTAWERVFIGKYEAEQPTTEAK